jgi:hypothetical protein
LNALTNIRKLFRNQNGMQSSTPFVGFKNYEFGHQIAFSQDPEYRKEIVCIVNIATGVLSFEVTECINEVRTVEHFNSFASAVKNYNALGVK